MEEKKELLLEILQELKRAKLAEIQEVVEEKKMEGEERYESLTGCDLQEILQEMVQEGVIGRQVPEWGAPVYSAETG